MMKVDKTCLKKVLQASLVLVAGGFLAACTDDMNTLHTINGIQVPPDPGAAGKATLAGIDSNNNGVRDDVERFIAGEYGSNKELYKSALSFAKKAHLLYSKNHTVDDKSLSNRFPDTDDPKNYLNHITCSVTSGISAKEYITPIEKQYLNTKERSDRYNELFGGMLRSSAGEIKCE